jgi:death on curing protein
VILSMRRLRAMVELKVRRFGNSLGVVLPKEVISRLHTADGGLLQSLLARPQQQYAEAADIVDMATAYTAGTVRNRPFLDGNKRTGFIVGILFLELNGYRFVAREEDAAQAVLKLAAGTLDEADYSSFLRGNVVRRKK